MNSNKNELTPSEYFNIVKDKKQHITDEDLVKVYDNCLTLLNKYKITGQTKGMKKLIFHLECIEKEREIVKMGINTFIYKDDIEKYIDNIAKDVVKIIELENYEREIPDEIIETISQVKDKFSQLYVVFTDYTGKIEQEVIKERREKDPILFGTFQDKNTRTVIDRFYFLGDWIDEYCDLTLDKMVNETIKKTGEDVRKEISTPQDIQELKAQLDNLDNQFRQIERKAKIKQSIFSKIRSVVLK